MEKIFPLDHERVLKSTTNHQGRRFFRLLFSNKLLASKGIDFYRPIFLMKTNKRIVGMI